jgi:Mg2+-importing ATPase
MMSIRRTVDARPVMEAYWSLPVDALLGRLDSGLKGLSKVEAARRRARFGPNSIGARPRASALRLLLRQFESPLILILVFAATIAAIVRDWTDAGIVLAILLGSGLLSFFQEYSASTALERLRSQVRAKSTVLRGGEPTILPSEMVVPGDVLLLSAGSLIPADGVLLEAKDFFVSQSVLTGESLPAEKQLGATPSESGIAARTNCVFMGTSVRSGTARMLVVRIGVATEFGAIADRLRLRAPETEFERGIRRYGYLLTQIMLLLVLLVFAANVLLDRPPVESLLFALALAVGMSPELLPAIISVTLARGARQMAAKGVIVRRLNAIENFGAMDVFCTDKTGTLTEGVMSLDGALDAEGAPSSALLQLAYLNARLQTGLENPLDEAIVARAEREAHEASAYRKIDEIPYDFGRKRLSVVVEDSGGTGERTLITKGAFANILEICDRVRHGEAIRPLDAVERARIQTLFEQWSSEGYRILGLATKPVPVESAYRRGDESAMIFAGFLKFLDPPKAGVRETLSALAGLSVQLKVITGDNRLVAQHLARSVGLAADRMVTGSELARLRDEALLRVAEATDLFVEVDPNQKERIILALKKAGHVVGYLGDGINDATALHAADVGISVDQAVDVAKEAADFVLLRHDLDVLRQGIEEGRRTFANTLKYIAITTSANFGNMISMAFASLFLPFLPLLAKQILLNNFLSDFPALSIAQDNVDRELIERPRRWDIRAVRNFMVVFGLVSSAFDFLTFGLLLYLFHAGSTVFQTGWFVESLLTELAIALVIRTQRPFYRSRPGRLLMISTALVMAMTLLLPYLPYADRLGFVPLPAELLVLLVAVTLAYVLASEAAKRLIGAWARRHP